MSEGIYKGTVTAKNGSPVPVFTNGRTFFSTYNPERDAENFCTAHEQAFSNAGCILVGGIGNGLHLIKLSNTYPEKLIIAFEADDLSLSFSRQHIEDISGRKIILTSPRNLSETLLQNYLPSLCGNFAFAAVRSWSDFLGAKADEFIQQINEIISDISADYSVQAQFGKIWHRNILTNLKLFYTLDNERRFNYTTFDAAHRKAAVIGAGPSLDESIHLLSFHRTEYCIFATDTSFGPLLAEGIKPDFVVTVDSQHISEKHFTGHSLEGIVIAADLTANTAIVHHALDEKSQVLYFHNNHPLPLLFDSWLAESGHSSESPFPLIDSGAGTVLHAAADLARKLGFQDVVFFGADFSYSRGKAYTKGTYLEQLYALEANRTGTAETAYSKLMFRTPLIPMNDTSCTTEILSRYRHALENYMASDVQVLQKSSYPTDIRPLFNGFLSWYLEKLQKKDKKVLFSVLPLAAWYKKNFLNADTECVYAFAEQLSADAGRIQCHLQKK